MTGESLPLPATKTIQFEAKEDVVATSMSEESIQCLGHASLEGFMLMEAVVSPWEQAVEELEARVTDQPAAIEAIKEALDRSEARLPSDKSPIVNLAFLGPTGVGKSELAKALADILGGGEGNLIKIDCSNFSHGHEVANLTGSPTGYVGHGETPLLCPKRVEKKGTVVLFDEVEKGSVELYDLMLQIMDDGELPVTVDKDQVVTKFRDTIVIMTSNLGAAEMSDHLSNKLLGFSPRASRRGNETIDDVATKRFKEFFKPEFLNRLDKMIVFHPLSPEGLGRVLDIKLRNMNYEYEQAYGARVSLSDATKKHLVELASQDMMYGARPLVRALETNIQAVVGRYTGAGQISEGTHVKVFHRDELAEVPLPTDDTLVFTAKFDGSLRKVPAPQSSREVAKVEVEYVSDEVDIPVDDGGADD